MSFNCLYKGKEGLSTFFETLSALLRFFETFWEILRFFGLNECCVSTSFALLTTVGCWVVMLFDSYVFGSWLCFVSFLIWLIVASCLLTSHITLMACFDTETVSSLVATPQLCLLMLSQVFNCTTSGFNSQTKVAMHGVLGLLQIWFSWPLCQKAFFRPQTALLQQKHQ